MKNRNAAICALGAACLALAGCGLFGEGTPPRPCPPVYLLEGANHLTKFREGPGRDITDIEFQARITNFTGSCEDQGDELDLDLVVDFLVERGPANRSGAAHFTYFLAIPKFYPRPEGKRSFDIVANFDDGRTRGIRREELELAIPIPPGERTRAYGIYIGLQLSPEQLDFNRGRTRR